MPIRPALTGAAIQQAVDRRLNALYNALTNVLIYAGEKVVNYARDPHRKRYKDRTGNLTSSIGYVVLRDGKVMQESDFAPVRGAASIKGAKLSGSKSGRKFLKKLIAENNEGLVLIVVAGMPYAAYVEAMGLDVLDSAEINAGEIVKRMLSKLRF